MKFSTLKRGLSLFLAMVLSIGTISVMPIYADSSSIEVEATANESVVFPTLGPGLYYPEGTPAFDGVPEHLDAFVEHYLDWVGLEGACLYSTGLRDSYVLSVDPDNPNKGKRIQGGLAAADNEIGIGQNANPTDFPTMVSLGQTWNKELMEEVGDVLGREKMITLLTQLVQNRNRHNGGEKSTTISFGVLSDLRINPLNGRFDEGYSEDVHLTSALLDHMASGFTGIYDNKASRDGSTEDSSFYTRGIVATKHTTMYLAEWFRQSASNSVSARGIYEYHVPASFKGFQSGSVSGGMTSFGRTNGVSNEISPYNILFNNVSKYGYYSSPDFNGENHMYGEGGMGNGYDTKYVPDRAHALALMALANVESVRAMGTDQSDVAALYNLVKSGAYGITEEDVRRAAKPLLKQMVRAGLFDEVGEDGFPKHYPYVDESKDGIPANTIRDNSLPYHQSTALQAAQEAVVILKNGDALPIGKDKKVAIAGVYADTRYKPTQGRVTTASNTRIPYSGETPLLSIARLYQEDGKKASDYMQYSVAPQLVAIQGSNGKYWSAQAGNGGEIIADFEGVPTASDTAQLFEVFSWGQEGVSLRSKLNGRWVTSPNANSTELANNNSTTLGTLTTDLDAGTTTGTVTSSVPPSFRLVQNEDGSVSLLANAQGTFPTATASTRYVETSAQDGTVKTASAAYKTDAALTNERKLTFTEIASAAQETINHVETSDVAIVFVGTPSKFSAGEGRDRMSMAMGDNDYAMVKNIAAAFAAKGKKTVVVVRSNFPVLMQQIQDDPNVSAILYQAYSGQYEGLAMAQALYGDFSPSGKLSSTWYDSDAVLPAISKYSIPEGSSVTLQDIDPRFTADMTNGDPQETGLTYMYADPEHIVYPFGYGLAYGDVGILYNGMQSPDSATADEPFVVTATVSNVGNSGGAEVVQLYARKIDSAYKTAMPLKKLVSFEKVDLPAAANKEVELTVDPADLAIWDVNRGDYIVESGEYELLLGTSANEISHKATITIEGDDLATLVPTKTFNVFDHSFASSDVVYREASKLTTATSLKQQKIVGEYYAVMSKGADSWVAIPNVNFAEVLGVTANVATDVAAGNISIRLDSPTGIEIANIPVARTGETSYDVDGIGTIARELGYQAAIGTIHPANKEVTGIHDIYLVFDRADLRIDTLQIKMDLRWTVEFDSNGGSEVESIENVMDDTLLTAPVEPTKRGSTFTGWYKDKEQIEKWDFTVDTVTDNMILYAGWAVDSDKAILLELVNKIENMDLFNAAHYTQDSWGHLQATLQDAKTVLDQSDVSLAMIEEAMQSLIQAIVALVPSESGEQTNVDRTILKAVADMVASLTETIYTEETWIAVQNALDAATAILEDEQATQAEIDTLLSELVFAIKDLVFADSEVLTREVMDAVLDMVATLTPSYYTNWDTVQEAVEAAKQLDDTATQDELNLASNAILQALTGLVKAVPSNILETLIALAESYIQEDYTAQTWDALDRALEFAKSLPSDAQAEQVDAAVRAIFQAMQGLISKADLNRAIAIAQELVKDNYTTLSWNAMQEALDTAKAIVADGSATKEKLTDAFTNLDAAIKALVKESKPTLPVRPGGSNSSSSGSSRSGRASSYVDRAIAPPAKAANQRPLPLEEAVSSAKAAVQGAAVKFRQISTISLQVNQAIAKETKSKVYIDSMSTDGKYVEVRVIYDPATATKEINGRGMVTSSKANSVKAKFEKWFTNKIEVVSLDQKDNFGMTVQIASKTKFTAEQTGLRFYSYDSAANAYTQIASPAYWFDTNGYIHFTTNLAGDIVISDGVLLKK